MDKLVGWTREQKYLHGCIDDHSKTKTHTQTTTGKKKLFQTICSNPNSIEITVCMVYKIAWMDSLIWCKLISCITDMERSVKWETKTIKKIETDSMKWTETNWLKSISIIWAGTDSFVSRFKTKRIHRWKVKSIEHFRESENTHFFFKYIYI